jgi:hypothetical protein
MLRPSPNLPSRHVNLDAARRTFGPRADDLGAALWKTDPLADAVIESFSELPVGEGVRQLDQALDHGIEAVQSPSPALVALFEHVDRVPSWVHWEQLDLGGAAFLRSGVLGLFVLGAGALPLSYTSPAGNKPLVISRSLVEMAPRRLFDTLRFHLETCLPGGLSRRSEGFKITIRVRLIHSQMRRLMLASGRWDGPAWGAPLNQADMAFTNVLFSSYPLEWLRRLGFRFTPEEGDAMIQLWRYSGYLIGVDPDLLAATEEEARSLGALYLATQARPDDDSRALVRALKDAAPALVRAYVPDATWISDVWLAMARFFLGDELLDDLGLPRTRYRHALPLVRGALGPSEALRGRSPRVNAFALRLGTAFERSIVDGGRAEAEANPSYALEAMLAGGHPGMRAKVKT